MATEVEGAEAVAASTQAAAPVAEMGSKHKLDRKWTFWFDNQPKQGAAWGTSLRKVYTFDTVEEFWWYVFRYFFNNFFGIFITSFILGRFKSVAYEFGEFVATRKKNL